MPCFVYELASSWEKMIGKFWTSVDGFFSIQFLGRGCVSEEPVGHVINMNYNLLDPVCDHLGLWCTPHIWWI